jgi:diaminohydroxyphosphoribosylaminopyrimidine deaminase/5-amino-6-(5-phosphoribosylamino)uracil reductase
MSTKLSKTKKDSFFMNLALMHAQKNLGNTSGNPSVGCVIVNNNQLVSVGSTSFNGRPHAEFNAINFSKKNLKNTSLYVTLEPCSHYGETPPCTKIIIKKKIKKVFFSCLDPDIRSFNKSSNLFKKNNIIVKKNILSKQIKKFYKDYYIFKKNDLPFVTLKVALTNDFYTKNKKKKWITNYFSRSRVHILRSNHNCLLTSSNTIIKDNPDLSCRIKGLEEKSPAIVILDKNLKVSISSKVLTSIKKRDVTIFFSKSNKNKLKTLKKLKVRLIKFPLDNDGNFNLKNVLKRIKLLGFSRLFIESGKGLSSNFLHSKLINNLVVFMSNKNIGKEGSKNFKKKIDIYLKNIKPLRENVNLFGDRFLTYRIK